MIFSWGHSPSGEKGRQKAFLTWEWTSGSPSVWSSYSEWPSSGCASCELCVSPPTQGFILKTRRSCQGLQGFPSSRLWWNKIARPAGKLAGLFFTWAVLLMAGIKDIPGRRLTASPETVCSSFRACSGQFPSKAIRHVCISHAHSIFVKYFPEGGHLLTTRAEIYFQGERGSGALMPQTSWD